jgi:hypothetical protein
VNSEVEAELTISSARSVAGEEDAQTVRFAYGEDVLMATRPEFGTTIAGISEFLVTPNSPPEPVWLTVSIYAEFASLMLTGRKKFASLVVKLSMSPATDRPNLKTEAL